ncbi:MAG: mechanosensitive ion channel family protein [Actinobacteria bacterium]|nr:mechanosensitive ion channel family protein [Actinomycetota bacterium]MCB9411693.1 mechanosensitive ion channel family protein [Actinomycetota bacterium]
MVPETLTDSALSTLAHVHTAIWAAAEPAVAEPTPDPSATVPDAEEITTTVEEAVSSGNWWLHTFLPAAVRVALIVVVMMLLRWMLIRLKNRTVRKMIDARRKKMDGKWADNTEALIEAERDIQRADTLGKLMQNVITITTVTIMVLLVLTEMGFNLGPLIAGAGIAGVALAFGAQSLVADFFSGIFMMLEDQFGVGDVVDFGDAVGTVEHVSLRVTQVRGLDGTLWFVRNGEVLRVGNMSQDWSRTLIDVGIAYGADIRKAREIMNRVGLELFEDEEFAKRILEAPEVWGVQQLGNDGVVLRMVAKTRPGEQWATSRELQERIKYAFDAEGIEIPFPQRTLWLKQRDGQTLPDSPQQDPA